MEVSELDKAVEYTKQFIEAATPIARKAYDIGLVTLRIDAISTIVGSAVVLAVVIFVLNRVIKEFKSASGKAEKARENSGRSFASADDYLFGMGIPHALASMMSGVAGLFAIGNLVSVWLWVKIFAPEFWLAHRAVEKLIN